MQQQTENTVRYLTDKQVTEIVPLSRVWFAKDRQKPPTERNGPPFVRLAGGRIFYNEQDVIAWAESYKQPAGVL